MKSTRGLDPWWTRPVINVTWSTKPATTASTTTTSTTTLPTISKIDEMANYLLNGTFKPEDAVDYGCSGRGFYDSFSATLGKHIDEADTAFYVWKKCIQCVLGHTE